MKPLFGRSHDADPGEPSTGLPRVSIAPDEEYVLMGLAMGRRCLEIGTGLGVSTRTLAATAESVTTVDIDPWVQKTIWPALPKNVETLPEITRGVFDFVFIDGDHTPTAFRTDLERYMPMLERGGLLVMHDANELRDHLPPGTSVLPTTYGIGVWR